MLIMQHEWKMSSRGLIASLQHEQPQYANMWWTDGREKEIEQLEHYGQRQNWTLKDGEE